MIVLWFILLIGPLIFFHELGHFLFAKLFKVKVLKFSLGFGPAIPGLRRKWGDTEYQIAYFPLGGYVRMLGDDPTEEVAVEDRARSFGGAALWKRYIIVAAGPVFNLILPVVIFYVALLSVSETDPATVGTVLPGSPAERAGLLPGDEIEEVNGSSTPYWRDMVRLIERRPDLSTKFVIRRQGQRKTLTIKPALVKQLTMLRVVKTTGRIGITFQHTRPQVGIVSKQSPAYAVGLRTGDLVTLLNGEKIDSWHDLHQALQRAAGAPIQLSVLRQTNSLFAFMDVREYLARIVRIAPDVSAAKTEGWKAYGIVSAEMFVDVVTPETPASTALKLRPGDQILRLDDKPVTSWIRMRDKLLLSPKLTHQLVWRTPDGLTKKHAFTLKEVKETDEFKQERKLYVFGAYNRVITWTLDPVKVPFGHRLTYALVKAPSQTWEFCKIMVVGVAQILRGNIPTDTIGGPIMLGHVANTAAKQGWEAFIFIMALISINLALINLLPIPILDGGHILIFTVEAVRRKPISLSARATITTVGLVLIVLLMVLAFANDCNRYIVPIFG